jgi:nickel/cobalt transporter (NicO) family protein
MQRRGRRAAPQLARRPRRARKYLNLGSSIGVLVLAATLLVAGATGAAAHPLGNFTVNTYSGLQVGPDRLVVDYVVDMAEIPTFQTRQSIDTDDNGQVTGPEVAAWRDRECPRLATGLRATVDGRPATLAVTGSALTFPQGVGGLQTLRLECALAAPLPAGQALSYTDTNLEDRVGWREITAVGDRATLEATNVPPTSPSARLTTYPQDQLSSPLNQRTAALGFHPGGPPAAPLAGSDGGSGGGLVPGSGTAPAAGSARENPTSRCEAPRRGSLADPGTGCGQLSTPPAAGAGALGAVERAPEAVQRGGVDRATATFTALVGERPRSPGFALVALLLAVGLGAAHALAPGHGKTVMAAYLVGLRGTLRQAATIGATVTLTHTAGVLLLGLVLTTSRAVASERVYPWLGLGSGLLLAGVGIGLLVRARPGHGHPHPHGHGHHPQPHGHGHDHGHHEPQPLTLQPTLAMPGPPEGEPNRQGDRAPASVHSPDHGHPCPHSHDHSQGHDHPYPHGQDHPDHPHGHPDLDHDRLHDHDHPHPHHQDDHPGAATGAGRPLGWRGLVALGLAGGLVPSPSAVVVLLGGIALGQAWFGVALVLAYGLGMAATLTGVGLLLAHLRTRMDRRLRLPAGSVLGRVGRLLPAATASVIVLVGLGLAASGAAQL